MNSMDLLLAIGEADAGAVIAAKRYRRSPKIKWLVAAALFLALIPAALILGGRDGLTAEAVSDIGELTDAYGGTLLAARLDLEGADKTDIRLVHESGKEALDPSGWRSVHVSAQFKDSAVEISCDFDGHSATGGGAPVETLDLNGVEVRIFKTEPDWEGYKYSYRAEFTADGVSYSVSCRSEWDPNVMYRYLNDILPSGGGETSEVTSVMGFEVTRVDAVMDAPGMLTWHYYAIVDGVETCIAEQFGVDSPEAWSVDIDRDGVTELVCNCVWGDGGTDVVVFRVRDGTIERCYTEWDLDALGFDTMQPSHFITERYDPRLGKVLIEDQQDNRATVDLTADNICFVEDFYHDMP